VSVCMCVEIKSKPLRTLPLLSENIYGLNGKSGVMDEDIVILKYSANSKVTPCYDDDKSNHAYKYTEARLRERKRIFINTYFLTFHPSDNIYGLNVNFLEIHKI
jgi:hypothetical protein